jgi:hypothetical protein
MKDKWTDVHKVESSTKFKSSDEILDEIAKQLLRLRDEGYDLTLPALPAPQHKTKSLMVSMSLVVPQPIWLSQHDEFRRAINVGREVFNPRVERALAERAIGFYADKYVWRKTTDKERKAGQPDFVLEPSERVYYPPDTTAGIYWSKNRMKDKWTDVH